MNGIRRLEEEQQREIPKKTPKKHRKYRGIRTAESDLLNGKKKSEKVEDEGENDRPQRESE